MKPVDRRTFLGTLGAASAFTIVPRRVLGGPGYIAPSDMILLAQVGCGTQAQRQVNTGLVSRTDLQFVAVVDPNRDSQDYVDWDECGNRERIRKFLDDPQWGASDTGIRAGRDVARQIMETYYKKQNRPRAASASYEDYREMLEKETDIQGIVNITPDHQHGSINISALRKGKAAISHKPVASVLHEVRACRAGGAREHGAVAPAGLQQQPGSPHAGGMDRRGRHRHRARGAQLDEPAVLAAGHAGVPRVRAARAAGLQLGAVAGARAGSSISIRATRSRSIAAGTRYGTGCLGDMGHYSLWQPYRILKLGVPEFVEARPNNDAFVDAHNVSDGGHVSLVAFPEGQHRALASSRHGGSAVGGHVLVRRRDEAADARGAVRRTARTSSDEGMLFIGDKGKILCDFRANKPRLIPRQPSEGVRRVDAGAAGGHDPRRTTSG